MKPGDMLKQMVEREVRIRARDLIKQPIENPCPQCGRELERTRTGKGRGWSCAVCRLVWLD